MNKDLKPDKAADKVELSMEDMERVSGGGGRMAPIRQKRCSKCGRWVSFYVHSEYEDHVMNCQGR